MISRCLHLAAAGLLTLVLLVADASPAYAHGVGGTNPSNYHTRVLSVEPEVDGLSVSVIDLGDRLEVSNETGGEIVVLGYEDEPYLRVGPDGVFENTSSPATWANRDRYATTPAPPDVDPDAVPTWTQVSSSHTARFHWHPAHWMSPARPGIVDRDAGSVHELAEWNLTIAPWHDESIGDASEAIVVHGDLRWVPGPSPVAPLLVGALGALAVILGCRTRQWPWVMAAALAALIATETMHFVGLWAASSDAYAPRLLQNLYSLLGIALAGGALWRLVGPGRNPYDGTPLALLAGLVLAVAGGLADVGTLTSSQLPSSLSPWLARAAVGVTLGLGVGVVVASAMRLRRPQEAATSA